MSVYPDGYLARSATISTDEVYRYTLRRTWYPDDPVLTVVMLNPSTADGREDDPTIRRCVGFARRLGCGALVVMNLYAYRSTRPEVLWLVDDPVGPLNDLLLRSVAADRNGPMVAAWGAHARPARIAQVLALPGFGRLQAWGTTKAGQPRHPLYLPADSTLTPWSPPC